MFNDFSRDSVGNLSPDHCDCDDSEHSGPESFYPPLAASFTRDSIFGADGSRSSDLQRDYLTLCGSPPRRDPVRDVPHFSPAYGDATTFQLHCRDWGLFVESPDSVHTPSPVQRDPSHGSVASVVSWNGSIYNPLAPDALLSYTDGFPSPTNAGISLWPQGAYIHDSYPNSASGGTTFPQNNGPLIQPPYLPHSAGRIVSTFEQTHSDHIQLSRNGSQGPSLIVSESYNPPTQHSTFGGDPPNSDLTFPPKIRMIVVPLKPYARTGSREEHNSIIFKVNGRLGIPVRDAIGKIYAGLEGRDDRVFVGKPGVIMLRLEWPGYLPWSRKIRLNDWKKTPQRIRLEKLATEVAKCLERFMEEVQAGKYPDRKCSDWRVDPKFIEIDRLVLVALDRVSRGSWQPRIGVLSE